MQNLFKDFQYPTKDQWIETLTKELKGADFSSSLIKNDEIEGISYPSFFHKDDIENRAEVPGQFPYTRGFYSEINDWSIVGEILVSDEKTANKRALELLMNGNTALIFEFSKEENLDLTLLFKDIKFEYIKGYFKTQNTALLNELKAYFDQNLFSEILFSYNPLAEKLQLNASDIVEFKNGLSRNFEIDAYSFQQTGANISQEIAFALSLGHEYLAQQIALGKTVDDALVNIHFTFGVGSNFLFEIAKLRAFRLLWSKIAKTYSPVHKCNETASVTSKTGFLNKSLQDPFTNLLRQTTEVMSAVLGGATQIINQAYDKYSLDHSSNFTERMAGNISLILKEESYLNQVLDAVGGSYAIESLTETFANKAWSLFQENEKSSELVDSDFLENIKLTSEKRISLFKEKKKTLIGINKFPNPEKSNLEWKENKALYFGLKQVVIENEIN